MTTDASDEESDASSSQQNEDQPTTSTRVRATNGRFVSSSAAAAGAPTTSKSNEDKEPERGCSYKRPHQVEKPEYTSKAIETFGYNFDLMDVESVPGDEGIVYSVCWNDYLGKKGIKQFAVAGEDRASVLQINLHRSSREVPRFQTLISFEAEEDKFYTVCWTVSTKENTKINQVYHGTDSIPAKGTNLLLFAGKQGIIRIIRMDTCEEFSILKAHGGAVNELQMHPRKSNLLLSASEDHSVRLWNLRTDTLVCIFGGVVGHCDQVVSASFAREEPFIVSGGADWTIKIWSSKHVVYKFHDGKIVNHLLESEKYRDTTESFNRQFTPIHVHNPYYSTNMVHPNIVDSVHFFAMDSYILSKSIEDKMCLWKPGLIKDSLKELDNRGSSQARTLIYEWPLPNTKTWFIKMAVSRSQNLVACGNQVGKICLFNFGEGELTKVRRCFLEPTLVKVSKNTRRPASKPIRQVAFSQCEKFMAGVSDDAKVFVYSIRKKEPKIREEVDITKMNGEP